MHFKLYIHYLCAKFDICLALYVQVKKNFTLSFMIQVKQLGATSQGECIR
jgi:ABC-type long-subunit fatty acid transport system fused permease/ATPase subunit